MGCSTTVTAVTIVQGSTFVIEMKITGEGRVTAATQTGTGIA